ncbi:MAG: GldG family protein [Gammaproteobacteria bacterium]|nr:GldG family protein [Gammaproteobacteria bacterium]NIR82735.1 GldG family protein [Gammaproteobacteria bacterium]NIR89599.1 GldG family protein [Gammaproteobacteria bacterium]NIU03895.1 GldG family protein [Gammaproteobacteria bacterium]NIV51211.1 ABC transporter [Gammaproteobacteria bacterium]
MEVSRRSRAWVRAQSALFVVLVLIVVGLLAWASARYDFQLDWTAQGRNTLSEPSQQLVARLDQPVRITAFATENEILRTRIRDLVGRYQREKSDITLEFVNPDTAPERVRALGITVDGELLLEYQGRSEHVREHSEQAFTNALQRLARTGERWIAYLTGHGERDLLGQANHDLGNWGRQLENRGFTVRPLNLAEAGEVPDNTTVLVIAGPQVDLLPGEVDAVTDYVAAGGNLLWLSDPGARHGLGALAQKLGVRFEEGVVVDATTQMFGISDPTFVLVSNYAPHAVTRDFDLITLYPRAAALDVAPPEQWQAAGVLKTSAGAWTEKGALEGRIRYDEGEETQGPFDIGWALWRAVGDPAGAAVEPTDEEEPDGGDPREQRVVVIGDGDFLSNAYLGNAGNLDLGMNLLNWLSSDDRLIAIPTRTARDQTLELSRAASLTVGIGALFVAPGLLLATGLAVWLRRRRR